MPTEEYTRIITRSMILAHLYGRSEMNDYLGKKRADHFAEGDIPSAFDEALKFFFSKNIITKKEFEKLDKRIRKYSFTVARADSQRMLTRIKESLDEALEEGITMAEWLTGIDDTFKNAGMDPSNKYHLETVFRNNMQTALNEGNDAIMDQADPDEFPLIEFIPIEDDRVRKSHLKLNGFRAPKNDPIWQKLRPPLDHHCRCRRRPVHVDENLNASNWQPVINPKEMRFIV